MCGGELTLPYAGCTPALTRWQYHRNGSETMEAINHMVQTVTAFRDWAALEATLQTGYVPTLFGKNRHERLLRKVIRAKGYRVWPAEITTERLNITE